MANILIVDDHEQDRYLLEMLLKGSGHAVTSCVHGADALCTAREIIPDLIVSDILMPVMDGFTLCRECRHDPNLLNIPFVYYTATYTDPQDEKFALEQGADAFILKPEEPAVLIDKLEYLICTAADTVRIQKENVIDNTDYYRMYSELLVRKLEEKVELFNTMFNVSPNIHLLLYPDLIIRELNTPAEVLFRVKECDVIDKISIADFIIEEERNGFIELLRSTVREGSFQDREFIVVAGGRVRSVSWSAGALRRSSGDENGIFLLGNDITEKLAARKRITEIEYQLSQIQKMEAIGQLASGIAHDVRNYISGIIGLSDLASYEIGKDSPAQEYLQQIGATCESAVRLTQQLLTFSSKNVHQPQLLDFNIQLMKMDKLLETLHGSGIKLAYELEDGLSPVLADSGQFEQVVMNLVINARDAIADKGEIIIATGMVTVDKCDGAPFVLLQPGTYVMLKVRDTGLGMDNTTLARIYEPFFTTKGEGKGTGLGLSTVYGIVRQCGGFIQCESIPGKGTEFFLYFPKADA